MGDQKIRTRIAKVGKKALQQQGGGTKTKFIVSFTNIDRELVLNATNINALVAVLGRNPADWTGAEVGIFTEPTIMAGKPTRGVRLRVLNKPSGAAPGGEAGTQAAYAALARGRGRSRSRVR